MNNPHLSKFVAALVGFALGACVGLFAHSSLSRLFFAPALNAQGTEAMRVTSPDGKLDAILVEDNSGGALGGVFWYVYVVPKGNAVPRDAMKRLFFADELTRGAISWAKPYLIEIHYDKASIMQFRNLSTTSENGIEYVELRLVPSAEYSLVTPEGGWRSDN
jgi:hypothetical protein